ncbi:MAG: hypothetical protein SGJ20_21640 [Planctomycetota bacterium]|nr:hypothetical protein [Planctomycetota bacterium]
MLPIPPLIALPPLDRVLAPPAPPMLRLPNIPEPPLETLGREELEPVMPPPPPPIPPPKPEVWPPNWAAA